MITAMFSKLSQGFSRNGSDRNGSARKIRTNRRYPIWQGIEGLEGRMAPSGGVGTVTVTVTNQGDTGTDTTTTGQDDEIPPVVVYGVQSTSAC
jgi:hypothetical protein